MLEPVLRPLSSFNEWTNDEPMSLPPPGMYRPIGDGLPRATVLQSIVLEWLLAKEGWPASSLGKLMYERLMLAAVPGGAGLNGCSSLFARLSTFSQEDVLLKEAAHPMGKSVTESACTTPALWKDWLRAMVRSAGERARCALRVRVGNRTVAVGF